MKRILGCKFPCFVFCRRVFRYANILAFSVVRVKLFQAFLLSGGANGRLSRGDEMVEMEFVEGEGLEEIDHEFLEPPTKL